MQDIFRQTEAEISEINRLLDNEIGRENLNYLEDEERDLCSVGDFRENYKDLFRKYKLDPSRKSAACRSICSYIAENGTDSELTYLWILLFLDEGIIYPYRAENADKIEKYNKRELVVSADIFERYCCTEAEYARRLKRIRDAVTKKYKKTDDKSKVPRVARKIVEDYIFSTVGTVGTYVNKNDIKDNMERIQAAADRYDGLNAISPLIMFLAVTGNVKSFMDNSESVLTVDIRKLFTPRKYKIDLDNGKNFKKYEKDVEFYKALSRAYSGHLAVDHAFCDYCFGRLTNLPKWASAYPLGNDFACARLAAPSTAADMHIYSDDEREYCCKRYGVDPELLNDGITSGELGEIVGGSESLYDQLYRYCVENPEVRNEMVKHISDGEFDKACDLSEKIGRELSDSCAAFGGDNFDYGVCYIYDYFLLKDSEKLKKMMLDTLNRYILLIDE